MCDLNGFSLKTERRGIKTAAYMGRKSGQITKPGALGKQIVSRLSLFVFAQGISILNSGGKKDSLIFPAQKVFFIYNARSAIRTIT